MSKYLFILLIGIILTIGVSSYSYALDSNSDIMISSDNSYIIISTDSSNDIELIDGGVSIDGNMHNFDMNKIKRWITTNDGEKGNVFGKTETDNWFYLKYNIDDESGDLFYKVWHDGFKTRVIEKALVQNLF